MACSHTLYFLFKVRRARVIKYKPQGLIDRQRKGVGVGENNVCVQAIKQGRVVQSWLKITQG